MGKFTKRKNPVYGKFTASRVQPVPRAMVSYQRPRLPSSKFGAIRTVKVKFLQSTFLINQNATSGADQPFAWDFRVNQMVDVSNYSGAFDAYRIRRITALIQGINGNNSGQTTALAPGPLMVSAFDPDDSANPASYAALLNYGSSMVHSPMCNDVRHFIPRLAVGTVSGSSGSNTGQANVGPMWIDFATTNVPHYGFKVYLPKNPSGVGSNLLTYQITFEALLDLRFNN